MNVILVTLEVDFSLETFLAAEEGAGERFVVGMLSLMGNSKGKICLNFKNGYIET